MMPSETPQGSWWETLKDESRGDDPPRAASGLRPSGGGDGDHPSESEAPPKEDPGRLPPDPSPRDELDWEAIYQAHRPRPHILEAVVGLALLAALWVGFQHRSRIPWPGSEARETGSPLSFHLAAGEGVKLQQSVGDWTARGSGERVPPGALLLTGEDRGTVLALPDGGTVRLDRETSIKLVRTEGSTARLDLLAGRLFVRGVEEITVEVTTDFLEAIPRRASFEVAHRSPPDRQPYSLVRVYSGSVAVRHRSRAESPPLVVEPGHKVVASRRRLGEASRFKGGDRWVVWNRSWTSPRKIPEFRDRPAAEVRYKGTEPLPPPFPASPAPVRTAPVAPAVRAPGYPRARPTALRRRAPHRPRTPEAVPGGGDTAGSQEVLSPPPPSSPERRGQDPAVAVLPHSGPGEHPRSSGVLRGGDRGALPQ